MRPKHPTPRSRTIDRRRIATLKNRHYATSRPAKGHMEHFVLSSVVGRFEPAADRTAGTAGRGSAVLSRSYEEYEAC